MTCSIDLIANKLAHNTCDQRLFASSCVDIPVRTLYVVASGGVQHRACPVRGDVWAVPTSVMAVSSHVSVGNYERSHNVLSLKSVMMK